MQNNKTSTATLNGTLPAIFPEVFPRETQKKLPKILEENVGNFCPSCGKVIFSNLLEIDGKVYLKKNCCTKELVFMENDVDFFCKYIKNSEVAPSISAPNNWEELISKKPNYDVGAVALYITTKCNISCPICFLKHGNCFNLSVEMSVKEVKERIKKYQSQKIYILGGEPTVHKHLWKIIKTVKESGNIAGIVTNGLKLENKNYLEKLKEAGLECILLQFDGFNKKENIRLRGRDYTEIKLRALKNIREVGGFRDVGLVGVIERGVNETEMRNIIQFALENEFVNYVQFYGLKLPPNENSTDSTLSDMIKNMEKYGYFDREYFLELVKMFRNIHETTRKIFDKTPLEDWIGRQLQGNMNVVVPFKKGVSSPQILFQRNEIKEIDHIFNEALSKKGRIQTCFVLFKNLIKLKRTPLIGLVMNSNPVVMKSSSSKKILNVSFRTLESKKNCLLKLSKQLSMSRESLLLTLSIIAGC